VQKRLWIAVGVAVVVGAGKDSVWWLNVHAQVNSLAGAHAGVLDGHVDCMLLLSDSLYCMLYQNDCRCNICGN
jgi:hypothetical protein